MMMKNATEQKKKRPKHCCPIWNLNEGNFYKIGAYVAGMMYIICVLSSQMWTVLISFSPLIFSDDFSHSLIFGTSLGSIYICIIVFCMYIHKASMIYEMKLSFNVKSSKHPPLFHSAWILFWGILLFH